MVEYLIQGNYITGILTIFFLIFIVTNPSFEKKVARLFIYLIVVVIFLMISDGFDYYFSTFSTPVFWRKITSAVGYTARPGGMVLICIIVKRRSREKLRKLYIIPIILTAWLCIVNLFTDFMFYFDATNKLQRGIIGFVPFFISIFYATLMVIMTIKEYRINRSKESYIVFLIAIMSILTSIIEFACGYRFLLNGIIITGTIFYYLFLAVQTYNRDELTHIFNRRCFFRDIEKYDKISMAIVSIDMNNLKLINDTKGHFAGDVALCILTDCIEKNIDSDCKLYRIGGDEFMLICIKKNQEEVSWIIENIKRTLSKTKYEAAFGVVMYKPGMNIERSIAESDSLMYEDKAKSKKKALAEESGEQLSRLDKQIIR